MTRRATRRRVLAATGLGLGSLAGCSVGGIRSGDAGSSGTWDGPPLAEAALPLPMDREAVRESVISGGPPRDGIAAIDDPAFQSRAEADGWLAPGDPVFGVVAGSEAKAYPQRILVHHEICNDTLNGQPVSVTYCPLTGTAMGFRRGGTTFGVSGRLLNNNLVMFDRATETWWPQVLATAVPGPWNPDPPVGSLHGVPVVWTTWERWRSVHPETVVLGRNTGYAENYASDPYGTYDPRRGLYHPWSAPLFEWLGGDLGVRFPPKATFVGARAPDGAVAFRKDALRASTLLAGTLGGSPALAVYDAALDAGYVYRNPAGATYESDSGAILGPDGEAHPPADLPLERVLALDAMWFAWRGFYPDGSVSDPSAASA